MQMGAGASTGAVMAYSASPIARMALVKATFARQRQKAAQNSRNHSRHRNRSHDGLPSGRQKTIEGLGRVTLTLHPDCKSLVFNWRKGRDLNPRLDYGLKMLQLDTKAPQKNQRNCIQSKRVVTLGYARVMAFIYSREDSPYWWIRFRDANGRTRQQSTGLRRDDPRQTRQARGLEATRTAEELSIPKPSNRADRWDAWCIDYLNTRFSTPEQAASKERVLYNWGTLRAFLSERRLETPSALRREHLFDFLTWRTEARGTGLKPVSLATALLDLKTLSVLVGEAVRRGWANSNPCLRLGVKRPSPRQKPELSDSDLAAIEAAIETEPEPRRTILYRTFRIARFQGCRLRETHLKMGEDVLLRPSGGGVIIFRTKGNRQHAAPLHPELEPLLRSIAAAGERETFSMPRGRSQLSVMWTRFLHRHRFTQRLPGLCFHSLRVTVVTRLARSNVPESKAMAYVGHATTTVHRIYQRLKLDDLQDCVSALASASSKTRDSSGDIFAPTPGPDSPPARDPSPAKAR